MTIRPSLWSQPCLRLSSSTKSSPTLIFRRHESSRRRTQKALRIKPHKSFLPSANPTGQDRIAYNPPASVPSVYTTPPKFLPKYDKRRILYENFTKENNLDKTASIDPAQLPILGKPDTKKYHLTPEQVEEIRALRTADPAQWTRERLSKKYECSSLFIAIICAASREQLEGQARLLNAVKAGWGRRRTQAREDRQLRRANWGYEEQ
ncbi:MAG: hypothetical protein M1814_005042 [Vezdaea aestivalis]|nr:MAG: hypothetical protein M1814_005042 [Vezdaea aestivalis]